MNQKMLIPIGVVTIIVIGAGAFFALNSSNNNSDSAAKMAEENVEDSMMNDEENTPTEDEKMMTDKAENSGYIEYSKANLDNASKDKRVLFFYASWCPICRPVDTELKNTEIIPDGVTVIRVNFNDPDTDQEEKDLAKKYDVTYQHTFVQIDENGSQLNKWSGGEIKDILSGLK